MTITNLLNEKEHTLNKYDYERQNQIAILYNAKAYKKSNFNIFLENPNVNLGFLDHDVLALLEYKDISEAIVIYLCLGEWKESHHGILKMIWSMNKEIKIVLVIDNVRDLPMSNLFDYSICSVLNSVTFFRSACAINELILNDVFLLDQELKTALQNLFYKPKFDSATGISKEGLKYRLNYTENEVLRLLSEGKSYDEIAVGIEKSMDSVRYYIKSLYKKLNVNNKGAAIRIYLKE